MIITADRRKLAESFALAAAVAPSRSTKPILQNVKMVADDAGECHLIATDLDVGVCARVPNVQIVQPGSVLLPAARMTAILRDSTDDEIAITAGSGATHINVRCGASKYKLASANPDEFPAQPTFDHVAFVEIPAAALCDLIHNTIYACDTESSRYALGGVLLEMDSKTPTMIAVATDGRRLAKSSATVALSDAEYNHGDSGMVIVPERAMQLIARILANEPADSVVRFHASNAALAIDTPTATLTSRLVEGRFPKWREVIPKRRDSALIKFVASVILNAVRQAAVVASDESRGINCVFSDGMLRIAASTAEVGESDVEMPIAYDGKSRSVTIDHRYIADFARSLPPDAEFTLDILNGEHALLLTADPCGGVADYQYVLMPLAG